MMPCEILREVLFFFFVALRSNWKVIVLVYGFPELRHAVYLFSYLCNVFMSPLHQQPLEIQSQSQLVQANYFCIWNAFSLQAAGFCNSWKHCKKWNILGEGGCSCNRTKEMTGVLFFPSESALNYCNAHMLPSAGSRYSAQSADPRAVFWEEYW